MDAMTIYQNMYDRTDAELEGMSAFELGYPMPVERGGRKLERAFVLGSNCGDSRPYAWLEADAQTGEVLRYVWCAQEDIVDGVPIDAVIDRTLSEEIDVFDFLGLRAQLLAAYEDVRKGGDIGAYAALFARIVPKGLLPYYKGLAPDFYARLEAAGVQ